jgi:hypothetical protein
MTFGELRAGEVLRVHLPEIVSKVPDALAS